MLFRSVRLFALALISYKAPLRLAHSVWCKRRQTREEYLFFWGAGHWTQGFMHGRQALHLWAVATDWEFVFLKELRVMQIPEAWAYRHLKEPTLTHITRTLSVQQGFGSPAFKGADRRKTCGVAADTWGTGGRAAELSPEGTARPQCITLTEDNAFYFHGFCTWVSYILFIQNSLFFLKKKLFLLVQCCRNLISTFRMSVFLEKKNH